MLSCQCYSDAVCECVGCATIISRLKSSLYETHRGVQSENFTSWDPFLQHLPNFLTFSQVLFIFCVFCGAEFDFSELFFRARVSFFSCLCNVTWVLIWCLIWRNGFEMLMDGLHALRSMSCRLWPHRSSINPISMHC